jgi:DNA-binding CsgD family transcriptional regulator
VGTTVSRGARTASHARDSADLLRYAHVSDANTEDSASAATVPCIEVVGGRSKGRVFPLERVRAYVIGRLPGADLHIDDPGVSRRHVKVTLRADGGVDAVDMRSTNGLIVNGEKLERAALRDGDLVALGPDVILRLEHRALDDLEPRPTPPEGISVAAEHTGPPPIPELPLSARQLEVSRLVANGMTNAAIAEALGISLRTVTSHLDHIYRRLEIGSRAALTRWMVEHGLTER